MKLVFVGTAAILVAVGVSYGSAALPERSTARVSDEVWEGLPPVYFCGEAVPLHEEKIARRMVSALATNSSANQSLFRMRQRASTFFPVIEPILAKYQIPTDFKYLPLVESALRGKALSPKGALGYWQLMPATARELGLSVSTGYDERRDLLKSTDAACRYLRYLHNQLGSWTLAAAAYNNGIGNLLSSIQRQQQRDYYFLRLNAETGRYLYRILAFKELFSNYRCYRPFLSPAVWASLNQPVGPHAFGESEEVLLSESFVEDATKQATKDVGQEANQPSAVRQSDMPLPNAADVFRGGIKAQLAEAGNLQRGQIWVFHLTRNSMTDHKFVSEGDILYAVVEDIDTKSNKLYLRAAKLYSATDRATYSLALAAVDASTGRLGIKLPDVDQVKAGWILTWKVL